MTSFAQFAPLIAGSIFLSLGVNYILHFYKFRSKSRTVHGKVTAIEKYVSTRRSSDGHTSQLLFRPVVEYVFEGKTHQTVGASLSEVRHRLNQTVKVLINVDPNGGEHQAIVDDSIRVVTGSVFTLVGLGALAAYVFLVGGSPIVMLVVAGVLLALGYGIANMMLNFASPFISNFDVNPGSRRDSTFITTPAQYSEEVSSHAFWGAIIAWGFMALSAGILYWGLNDLPKEAIELMQTDFAAFWEKVTSGQLESSWERPLVIAGIGLFFFLASLRSVYYVHSKYGGLLRR